MEFSLNKRRYQNMIRVIALLFSVWLSSKLLLDAF